MPRARSRPSARRSSRALKSSALAKGKLAVALNQAADDAGCRAREDAGTCSAAAGAKAAGRRAHREDPAQGHALGEHLRHPPPLRPSDRMPWDLLLCGFMAYIILGPYHVLAPRRRVRARARAPRVLARHTHAHATLSLPSSPLRSTRENHHRPTSPARAETRRRHALARASIDLCSFDGCSTPHDVRRRRVHREDPTRRGSATSTGAHRGSRRCRSTGSSQLWPRRAHAHVEAAQSRLLRCSSCPAHVKDTRSPRSRGDAVQSDMADTTLSLTSRRRRPHACGGCRARQPPSWQFGYFDGDDGDGDGYGYNVVDDRWHSWRASLRASTGR